MSVRRLGKSTEEVVRQSLRSLLSEDPEVLELAYKLLDAYMEGGRRSVRRLVVELLEAGKIEDQA